MKKRTERRSTAGRVATVVALASALIIPGTANAEDKAPDPAPRIELSSDELVFVDEGGTLEVRIRNGGDASLHIYGARTVEEGFIKRLEHAQSNPTIRHEPDRVFSVEGVPLSLESGEHAAISVKFVRPQGSRQRRFLGAVQLFTNDLRYRRDTTPGTSAGSDVFVVPIKLDAGGSWLYRNVLVLMTFIPLLGMFLLMIMPRGQEKLYRWFTVGVTAAPLVLAGYVWNQFDTMLGVKDGTWGLQFVNHFKWIESFNIEFFFGVDGISVLMVVLTALVSFIAAISSMTISKHVRGYMMMFLLLEAGMMGTFVALDFFLFYVFWEIMLLPMYFLIGVWGGPRKEYAAIKFFLYTLAGSVLMLLALIALYYTSGPAELAAVGQPLALVDGTPVDHTFDLMKLTYMNSFMSAEPILGVKFSHIIWVALFIGFAIKVPMFPFHTWLPDAHVEAPTPISVILAGVLLKMGIYGMFRMNFQILPDATQWAALAMATFGAINILYGAFCAFAQTDLKKLVAYSSVSHMGFCLLGMAAFTSQGMSGSIMQMFNHGTITSMLFLLVGVIYDRAHTRDINAFGGVASKMPVYAAFFGFAFMASLGLPGLSGFIGEALVFLGAFNQFRVIVILSAFGVIVTAAYHLWSMQRVMLGKFNTRWSEALSVNLDTREKVMLIPLAVIVLFFGFYPVPALDMMSTGIADLRAIVEGAASTLTQAGM